MNKIPRFMKEYANYQIRNIENNNLMQEKFKTYGINRIKKVLRFYEKGMIVIDEAMYKITNYLEDYYNEEI